MSQHYCSSLWYATNFKSFKRLEQLLLNQVHENFMKISWVGFVCVWLSVIFFYPIFTSFSMLIQQKSVHLIKHHLRYVYIYMIYRYIHQLRQKIEKQKLSIPQVAPLKSAGPVTIATSWPPRKPAFVEEKSWDRRFGCLQKILKCTTRWWFHFCF